MNIEIHLDWHGQPHLIGRLYVPGRGISVSFQYAEGWLSQPGAFPIDPTSLPLQASPHHAPVLFGAFQDCGPDRWGRMLIERAVRKKVVEQKPYRDIDYVIALDDASRIGALRFKVEGTTSFLAVTDGKIPPLVRLNALLNAADAIHGDTETAEDLRFLLGQGSPLGGARPKSSVLLPDGRMAIAKFPKPDDIRDIEAGEVLALILARKAGIRVADHQLVSVEGKNVAVFTRFDREGSRRIPFLSACTLLGLSSADTSAYTSLAEGIRQFGDNVPEDLRELWRRLVFSLLASNYDDHMRNHGFLMLRDGKWSLSPAYDLNPVPEIDRARTPKTSIGEESAEISVAEALKHAPRFGLKAPEAKKILGEVYDVVVKWRQAIRQLHLSNSVAEAYATAFEHPLMEESRKILKK
jgi:serine/threonine-protein kinase HipA